jgi:hypothetical protein
VDEFDADKEEWVNYKQRLDIWLSINKIADGDRAHVFLAKVGAKAFETLVNLCAPDQVKDKNFKTLCELCEKHYKVTRTVEGERVAFRSYKQKPGQSVTDFAMQLKKLCRYCNYPDVKDALKETFIANLLNQNIRARVLGECEGKTFDHCLERAVTLEKIYQETKTQEQTVRVSHMSASNVRCHRCHGPHLPHSCPHQNAQCYKCQQKGHLSRACPRQFNRSRFTRGRSSHHFSRSQRPQESGSRSQESGSRPQESGSREASRWTPRRGRSRGRGRGRSVHRIVENDNEIDDLTDSLKMLYSITCVDDDFHDVTHNQCDDVDLTCDLNLCEDVKTSLDVTCDDNVNCCGSVYHAKAVPPEIETILNVAGVDLKFVVDTASPVTVIPRQMYEQHFAHLSLSTNAKLGLRSYTQDVIPMCGSIVVPVKYRGQCADLTLYVVEGPACLLGRQWLQVLRLDWSSLFSVRNVNVMDGLLKRYADVFSVSEQPIREFKAEIQVQPGSRPRFFKPRTLPYALKDKVAAELDVLESRGVVTKITRSDWAAPLVVVPKQNGALRLCGDYKITVNEVIVPEPYPLPTADDLFASLANGEVFSKLDLSAAYQQVELTEESKAYLTINTHKGLYRLNRLSFGVSTAPNVFQRIMDQLLQDIPNVVCYLDDILIATSKADHLKTVEAVLKRLQQYNVKVKKEKCSFLKESVQYLGHIVSKEGLKPTSEKIKALQEMKAPSDVRELRVLLGLVNYYARFIPNQANLLSPWYKLLQKKTTFVWSAKCEKVLELVKKKLTSCDTLAHYDPSKPLTLACDAGPEGVGCVLSHVFEDGERPIAFASRTLTAAEKNYCQLEREGLAIIYGLRKFHKYLYGRRFTIITDNQPIAKILGPKTGIPSLAAMRLQRWALITMAYDYNLQTRRSQEHANCDALSRLAGSTDNFLASELPVNYFSLVDQLPLSAKELAEATRKDPVLTQVTRYVMSGWPAHCDQEALRPYFNRRQELSIDKGCLLWGIRVVVPPCYRDRLLEELHMTHSGIVRMKALSRSYFWFPHLDTAIEDMVNGCEACQAMQKESPSVPLIPWEYPTRIWERVHIDFGEFDKRNFLLLVDAHTKWLEVVEMKTTTSHQTIIQLRRLFASYGLPEVLVSDNGPQLVSWEMEQFLRNNGIRHSLSPPYHPATNGAVERCVQTVKTALKKFVLSKCGGDLDHALQNFLFQYRVTPHSTTGRSPAEMFLKRLPRTRFALLKPDVVSTVHEKQIQHKEYHDANLRVPPSQFQVGEIVLVKNVHEGISRFVKGVIAKVVGPYRYVVRVGHRCRYVHLEHLKKVSGFCDPYDPANIPVAVSVPLDIREEPRCEMESTVQTPRSSVPLTLSAAPTPSTRDRVATPESDTQLPRRSSRVSRAPERLIETKE